MVDVPGMAVSHSAEKLKGKPFLLNVFQKRTRTDDVSDVFIALIRFVPEAVIERAMNILTNKITIGARFDDSVISQGVWHARKLFSLL
jgi:hypothetical protein